MAGTVLPEPYDATGTEAFLRDIQEPDAISDEALAWLIDIPSAGPDGPRGLRSHSAAKASLGQPLGWWGADRLDGKESDRWLLVRFAVSFRAEPGTEVEWARLSVDLPQTPDDHAIVIDQYPDDFLDEEQRDLHLTLSPQLKFMQVSARLGAASASIQIAKVTPVISSWGGQEASFGWDLTRTDRHPIVGVKHFYAIISCPSPELAMSLGIDADVRVPGGFLRRGQRSGPSRQRQVQVLRQQWN